MKMPPITDCVPNWEEITSDLYLPTYWKDVAARENWKRQRAHFSALRGMTWLAFCLALFAAGLFAGAASQRMSTKATIERIEVLDVDRSAGVVTLAVAGEIHDYGYLAISEGSAE